MPGLETQETMLTSVYSAVDFIASASSIGEVATFIKGRQSILPAQSTSKHSIDTDKLNVKLSAC